MAKVPKIHARMACFIADDLRRRRLGIDALLKEVGLQKADLSSPENPLPQSSVLRLIERAADLTEDASYGLRLGAARDPRDRGLLGFIALNSPTLLDAMSNIQRFYKLAREGGDFEIERTGAQVALRFRVADLALRGLRHNSEFLAATIVRGCRDLTCQSISPIRVEFIHAEPKNSVEYSRFLGCPVTFGAEWDAVIYAEEMTHLPVQGADEKLLQVLEVTCRNLLGPTSRTRDLVREVRQLIIERLPRGSVGIDAIAEELCMSSRTLERRLAEQGQTFSDLLDRTRFNAVRHYLRETDMRLTQVAYLAGYTEPAALVRAFKRWTGDTPSKFRERPRSSMSN
jgi:AraC-like DNA-binding protein